MKDIDTLLAVVAGGIYRRTIVLRSTLYSPIATFGDVALNSVELSVSFVHYDTKQVVTSDEANNSCSITVEKTAATKPETNDYGYNAVELTVVAYKKLMLQVISDEGGNSCNLTTVKFDVPRAATEDIATNSVSIGVTKL